MSNVNITINKNSTIALVGASGAGKSTIVDLVTGILKPCSGTIVIDDMDYSDIDMQSLRNMFGYVTQETVIFDDTIANNISLWHGGDNAKDLFNRIVSASQEAGCEEFVLDKPCQYDTRIGDRGIKLSGGQRQRLATARELFKHSEIIILDEATSSLDAESELYIKQSINRLKKKKTIIIIAHRLSTIKDCDYIYVLKEGLVIEEGSYSELFARKDSNFRKMCEMQSL
ncbi:MAG: ATP-binding cassette domain-containing protein [Candidatus Scalindua sp.]